MRIRRSHFSTIELSIDSFAVDTIYEWDSKKKRNGKQREANAITFTVSLKTVKSVDYRQNFDRFQENDEFH